MKKSFTFLIVVLQFAFKLCDATESIYSLYKNSSTQENIVQNDNFQLKNISAQYPVSYTDSVCIFNYNKGCLKLSSVDISKYNNSKISYRIVGNWNEAESKIDTTDEYFYEYNGTGQLLKYLHLQYKTSSIDTFALEEYNYLTDDITLITKHSSGFYNNSYYLDSLVYNNGLLVYEELKRMESDGSYADGYYYFNEYNYDIDGNLIEKILGTVYNYEKDYFNKDSYFYTDGLIDSNYYYNYIDSNWDVSYKKLYFYNNENNLNSMMRYDFDDEWIPYSQQDYTYNNGYESTMTSSEWFDEYSTMIPVTKNISNYNTDGIIQDYKTYSWNMYGWLEKTRKIHYYSFSEPFILSGDCSGPIYNILLNTNECDIAENINQLEDQYVVIYPNPNNGKFEVTLEDYSNNIYNINIYSNDGKLIYNSSFLSSENQSLIVDLGNQSPGLYFITISDGKNLYKSKLMINR